MLKIIIAILALITGYKLWKWWMLRQRQNFIDDYAFHPGIVKKFREVRPDLTQEQEELVFEALRDYFHMCSMAGRRMVSMPSQVVDDAWHTFILFTRPYQQYCRRAFGRFLHHTPAEAMKTPTLATQGIKRAWRLACAREGIDPKNPKALPLIFSIDSDLKISNGFYYVPDCMAQQQNSSGSGGGSYCGSHVGCAGGCCGDSGSDSGCGGDSGGGCGGGCGGD